MRFGAPVAHEEHAQRACHVALAVRKAMDPLRREGRETFRGSQRGDNTNKGVTSQYIPVSSI